ncbi:MAG: transposase [Proteobacteria bacterium]|nr:transposase [Pseudomonadota bacterium]
MEKFIESDPRQAMLLPVDLREWVPEDDLSHFVLAAVERVPMHRFRVNERGSGSAQYHPRTMLALLIYSYANGVFGSRRIERATYRDIGARYITADTHPDHDTICKFRRENFEAVAETFLQVLLLARELKLVRVGTVSVDGTKVKANASRHRSVRYDRAKALVEQLRADIDELLARAEQADAGGGGDSQSLPEALRRREALAAQLDAACERLECEAKARAESEQGEYERKVAAREKRSGKRKGKKIKPPDDTPGGSAQTNLTDPDSALMRKSKAHEYTQSYNAQAVVDAQGSQLVLATRVSGCASDANELVADVQAIPDELGCPERVLADNGFADQDEVECLERMGIEALVAMGAAGRERRYDFRPPKEPSRTPVKRSAWAQAMQDKLDTETGRALYRLRQQTVEPVFGVIKHVLGFTQFMLRGHGKVEGEWQLVCLAYNCKRLHRLLAGA